MERLMRRLNGSLSRSVRRSVQDVFQQSPLDLRFALQKTLDPRVSFTRASSGTYVGSDGLIKTAATNEPRFDHNPTTGESLGLLVEEARTNLWQWSNSATNGETWNNVNTHLTLTAGQTGPAGDSTAIRAADVDSATTGTFLQRTTVAPALTIGTFVSYSIFIKPINISSTIGLVIFANGTTDGVTGTFAVSGTAITGTATVTLQGTGSSGSASYVAYPNGWYRLTVSGIPSTVTMADCRVRINLGSYTRSTGTARFDWYGGQFENNAFASSYFSNAGTLGGVTRAADVANITGSNFSSWYNQTEGTVFANATTAVAASILPCYASIDNGTTSERLQLRRTGSGANPSYRVVAGGQSIDSATKTIGSPAGFNSQTLAYASSNYEGACNGTLEGLISIVNRPTATQLQIGNGAGSAAINGTIKRLTFWPTRLANNTLQQITQS